MTPRIVAQLVDVAHAVRNVVAVCPHTENAQVADGLGPPHTRRRQVYLNNRALLDLHVFQRFEDWDAPASESRPAFLARLQSIRLIRHRPGCYHIVWR